MYQVQPTDKAGLIHYNDRMMRTMYNELCAWHMVWKINTQVINEDATLRKIINIWKSFRRICGDLATQAPTQEKVISVFLTHGEAKFTEMHNEYIRRGQ